MIILSIETSCDETAVSVLSCKGSSITVLGNALASQIELHAQYGGVFPSLAKRAHTEKIVPLLAEALGQAGLLKNGETSLLLESREEVTKICSHEGGLSEAIISFVESHMVPDIDYIAVTAGPGLEPALWVGINAATALANLWHKPLYPINHMEGHVISAVFEQNDQKEFTLHELAYPALALLVSGGHTELILIESSLSYKKIGHTLDDAVGEAFDKVARILGLPYPGGPKISAFAKEARERDLKPDFSLPRPMLHSGTYDFSYSGLKTAVLYATQGRTLTEDQKKAVAREFEEAAIEVLVKKTKNAVEAYGAQTVIVGGGVAANSYLRDQLSQHIPARMFFPTRELSTDNSIMIGMALYYELLHGNKKPAGVIKANGNLSIDA